MYTSSNNPVIATSGHLMRMMRGPFNESLAKDA